MRALNLENQKFGELKAIKKLKERKNGKIFWLCQCSCGKLTEVRASHLSSGAIISCGCVNRLKIKNRTHGQSLSFKGKQFLGREYISWKSMKQRCLNPNYTFYKNYGGRGITICNQWVDDFKQFFKDMGLRPQGTSLDRKNNEEGYYPENCRWADRKTQRNNRRNQEK